MSKSLIITDWLDFAISSEELEFYIANKSKLDFEPTVKASKAVIIKLP